MQYFLVAVVIDNRNQLVLVELHKTNKLETKEYQQAKNKKSIVSSLE